MRWRGYNIRRTRRPFPQGYYADPRLARINLLARRSAKESVPDVSAGSHVIRRVRHDSLVETLPSDLISGSDPSPVLGGSGTPTGQRKLSGRPAGKGTILTLSLWLPPRHMRLPWPSRPTTMAMCPPPERFIGAKAPTAGPASFSPQSAQSSAHRVSVPLIPTLVSTMLAYSAHQGISSCLYSLAISPPSSFAQLRISGLSASPAASWRPSHFRPSITQRGRVSAPGGGGAGGWPCGRWVATGAPATAWSIACAVSAPTSPSTSRLRCSWKSVTAASVAPSK